MSIALDPDTLPPPGPLVKSACAAIQAVYPRLKGEMRLRVDLCEDSVILALHNDLTGIYDEVAWTRKDEGATVALRLWAWLKGES